MNWRKQISKYRNGTYNLVVWDADGKVVYNNVCIGKVIKRRLDCDIIFKKLKKSIKSK